jgi:hypothetical protein
MAPQDLLTVTDVNQDRLPDLLISRYQLGTILYYQNVGTLARPDFQLRNQSFGGFEADYFTTVRTRSLVITDVNHYQHNELILAADDGTVKVYEFPLPPYQSLTLLDSLPALGYTGAGLIATAADLDGDELPDLLLGSTGGGLRYLRNTSQKQRPVGLNPETPWVYPSPADDYLLIRSVATGQVELLSLLGQVILPARTVQAHEITSLEVKTIPAGLYLVRLTTVDQKQLIQKVIISR